MPIVVKDLLSSPPVSLKTNCTIAEALAVVLEQDVTEIYVTDDAGGLLGVVTDYELLKSQMTDTVEARSIETVLCRCPAVASVGEPVAAVAGRFREARHSQMAVIEEGKLVGVIHRHDIMRTMRANVVLSEVSEQVEVETAESRRAPRYMQSTSSALESLAAAGM